MKNNRNKNMLNLQNILFQKKNKVKPMNLMKVIQKYLTKVYKKLKRNDYLFE